MRNNVLIQNGAPQVNGLNGNTNGQPIYANQQQNTMGTYSPWGFATPMGVAGQPMFLVPTPVPQMQQMGLLQQPMMPQQHAASIMSHSPNQIQQQMNMGGSPQPMATGSQGSGPSNGSGAPSVGSQEAAQQALVQAMAAVQAQQQPRHNPLQQPPFGGGPPQAQAQAQARDSNVTQVMDEIQESNDQAGLMVESATSLPQPPDMDDPDVDWFMHGDMQDGDLSMLNPTVATRAAPVQHVQAMQQPARAHQAASGNQQMTQGAVGKQGTTPNNNGNAQYSKPGRPTNGARRPPMRNNGRMNGQPTRMNGQVQKTMRVGVKFNGPRPVTNGHVKPKAKAFSWGKKKTVAAKPVQKMDMRALMKEKEQQEKDEDKQEREILKMLHERHHEEWKLDPPKPSAVRDLVKKMRKELGLDPPTPTPSPEPEVTTIHAKPPSPKPKQPPAPPPAPAPRQPPMPHIPQVSQAPMVQEAIQQVEPAKQVVQETAAGQISEEEVARQAHAEAMRKQAEQNAELMRQQQQALQRHHDLQQQAAAQAQEVLRQQQETMRQQQEGLRRQRQAQSKALQDEALRQQLVATEAMEKQAELMDEQEERASQLAAKANHLEATLRTLRARERLLVAQEMNAARASGPSIEQWIGALEQWTAAAQGRVGEVEARLGFPQMQQQPAAPATSG